MSRDALLTTDRPRCGWVGTDPLYIEYHDREWCRPCHDDTRLFEFLILEMFQAGLSWITILRKRAAFRKAFSGWDVAAIAGYGDRERARLLGDAGIVRNRRKIDAAIQNAGAFLTLAEAEGSFSSYLWSFTEGEPLPPPRYRHWSEMPAESTLSRALSRDLRQRGFAFVGPVICYSYLQAAGLVNDHLDGCFCLS